MGLIFDSLINLFFPDKCLYCGQFASGPLCDWCLKQIKRSPKIVFPFQCPLNCLISFGQYRGILEVLIKGFKFHNKPQLADKLAGLLFSSLTEAGDDSDDSASLVVPVPLFLKKEKERGYNQSFLLARELGRCLKLRVSQNLIRVKDTPPLYTLSRTFRFKILKKAFESSNPHEVKGKTIFLVDDIFTTGATLFACANILKKAGVRKVMGLTVVRA